eukprot:13434113-Alexandrium_andersonii.AAC.1
MVRTSARRADARRSSADDAASTPPPRAPASSRDRQASGRARGSASATRDDPHIHVPGIGK